MDLHESYWVDVTKDQLVFSAAHFITYQGNCCERLHGHNYRVEARVRGPLDANHYVVDFIALRDTLHALVSAWDHHVLLPGQHPHIDVAVEGQEVIARFEDRRWVFPLEDCVILPIANTTTELLARQFGRALLAGLAEQGQSPPQSVRIAIDENYGQWGVWEGTRLD